MGSVALSKKAVSGGDLVMKRLAMCSILVETMIAPPPALQIGGKVAVLEGPACISACELFTKDLTAAHRATIVGEYPTAGAGGAITFFTMPENIWVQMPVVRILNLDGTVRTEGKGVDPTWRVPVTRQTLREADLGGDPVLDAAVTALTSN